MQDSHGSLVDLINAWGGGAALTVVGATLGRLMWHSSEARKGNRKFLGKELFWELPFAFGMGVIGEAIASYFGLPPPIATGVIVGLAYMGPRGFIAMFERWMMKRAG